MTYQSPIAGQSSIADQSPVSVLLVDTQPELLFATAGVLADLGYRVLAANGVDQAMAIGDRESFELLICSESLKIGNAQLLYRFLRRNKRLRKLRLVELSDCQPAGIRLKKVADEAVYCIRRNVCPDAIQGVLSQTLSPGFSQPSQRPSKPANAVPAPHFDSSTTAPSSSANLPISR